MDSDDYFRKNEKMLVLLWRLIKSEHVNIRYGHHCMNKLLKFLRGLICVLIENEDYFVLCYVKHD